MQKIREGSMTTKAFKEKDCSVSELQKGKEK
jgi:hypothetical protein